MKRGRIVVRPLFSAIGFSKIFGGSKQMRRFSRFAVVVLWCGLFVAKVAWAEGGDTAVAQADHAFVQAAAKQDSEEVGKLLDADFTWTNAAGKTITRAEVISSVPTSPMGDESAAKIEHRDFGQVVAILSAHEKNHVLGVWIKRGSNWRLLVYHEVSQAETAQSSSGTGVAEC